jgi:hypothetical protein
MPAPRRALLSAQGFLGWSFVSESWCCGLTDAVTGVITGPVRTATSRRGAIPAPAQGSGWLNWIDSARLPTPQVLNCRASATAAGQSWPDVSDVARRQVGHRWTRLASGPGNRPEGPTCASVRAPEVVISPRPRSGRRTSGRETARPARGDQDLGVPFTEPRRPPANGMIVAPLVDSLRPTGAQPALRPTRWVRESHLLSCYDTNADATRLSKSCRM